MIKIATGFSHGGGSTIAHINLVNELNKLNIEAKLYGPHDWHLNKCNSDLLQNFKINNSDIVLIHFLNINFRPDCKKFILSCHETKLFPLKELPHEHYDLVHFVSDFQKNWHNITHKNVIIPPITYAVNWLGKKTNCAGVIGSIDPNKRTHLSIERALLDGYQKVLLFGNISDHTYFFSFIQPFIKSGKAIMVGHLDNKELMYNSVDKVYHSSIIECCPLVKAECILSGIPYSELDPLPNDNPSLPQDIITKWLNVFNL